jgi:NitT/TauT family transport system permease protein
MIKNKENIKNNKISKKGIILSLFSVLVFIIIWESFWQLGLLNELFFSSPSRIFISAKILAGESDFWKSFSQTFIPFTFSLLVASVSAIIIGIFLGLRKPAYYLFRPYIYGFNSLPKIVLLPIFILWFGLGDISKIIVIFITAFIPILINVIEGVGSVDRKKIQMANSFNAPEILIAKELYFYMVAPYFLAGVRSTIGKTIGITIIAEYSGVGLGLGRELAIYSTRLETDNLFALAFILIAISLTTTFLLDILSARAFRKII